MEIPETYKKGADFMKPDKLKTLCPHCAKPMEKVGVHKPIYICLDNKCNTKMEQLTLF